MLVVEVYSNSSSAPKRASSTVLRASSLTTSAIAPPTSAKRMRRPRRLFLRFFGAFSRSEASRRLSAAVAQVLLHLLVAAHGLYRALAVASRSAVGAARGFEGIRGGCHAALRPRSGAAHRGSRGQSNRGPRPGSPSSWSYHLLAGISGGTLRITPITSRISPADAVEENAVAAEVEVGVADAAQAQVGEVGTGQRVAPHVEAADLFVADLAEAGPAGSTGPAAPGPSETKSTSCTLQAKAFGGLRPGRSRWRGSSAARPRPASRGPSPAAPSAHRGAPPTASQSGRCSAGETLAQMQKPSE